MGTCFRECKDIHMIFPFCSNLNLVQQRCIVIYLEHSRTQAYLDLEMNLYFWLSNCLINVPCNVYSITFTCIWSHNTCEDKRGFEVVQMIYNLKSLIMTEIMSVFLSQMFFYYDLIDKRIQQFKGCWIQLSILLLSSKFQA